MKRQPRFHIIGSFRRWCITLVFDRDGAVRPLVNGHLNNDLDAQFAEHGRKLIEHLIDNGAAIDPRTLYLLDDESVIQGDDQS